MFGIFSCDCLGISNIFSAILAINWNFYCFFFGVSSGNSEVFLYFFEYLKNFSLKRTENLSRSPLFEQISLTLDGLTTIHSYSQSNRYLDSLKTKLDENSGSMFMFNSAMRW